MQRFLVGLTAINLVLFAYLVMQLHTGKAMAATDTVPDVIRTHSLQIVDQRGVVRASLAVYPENPAVQWKGKPYPETVLFRLISPDGRPNVKMSASKQGSALALGGEADPTYIQLLSEGGQTTIKLVKQDGTERMIAP